MSEKVKLPKEVCDALDKVMNPPFNYISSKIITNTVNQSWGFEKNVLNTVSVELLMRALVLGYEAELTAKEQIKHLYKYTPFMRGQGEVLSYQKGIIDTLRVHGIKYDWMDDVE